MSVIKPKSKSTHLLAASVLGAAAFGLALSLTIPYVLDGPEYARFSLALSSMQLISNMGVEWVRVSVVRHAGDSKPEMVAIRRTLFSLYSIVIVTLLVVASLLLLASLWWPLTCMGAAVCAAAALQGAFDGRSALARARFENFVLAISIIARPALTVVLVTSIALVTRSAHGAILGIAISYLLAFAIFRDPISLPSMSIDLQAAKSLASFGVLAALGTNVAIAVPTMLRVLIISVLGSQFAGGTLLALDISQRIFSTVGLALNLVHLQSLVRVIDTEGKEEAVKHARGAIGLEVAFYGLMAAGLVMVAMPLGNLYAPTSYKADFIATLPWMAFIMVLLTVRQYAIEPLFIAWKRVKMIAIGPLATLISFLLIFLTARAGQLQLGILMPSLVAASFAGLTIAIISVHRQYPGCIPVGALICFGGASLGATVLTPSFAEYPPLSAFIARGASCSIIYGAMAILIVWASRANQRCGEK